MAVFTQTIKFPAFSLTAYWKTRVSTVNDANQIVFHIRLIPNLAPSSSMHTVRIRSISKGGKWLNQIELQVTLIFPVDHLKSFTRG